jgi:hypothetical protein
VESPIIQTLILFFAGNAKDINTKSTGINTFLFKD